MEPPQLRCPQCGKTGPLRPEMIGCRVKCPECQTRFVAMVTEPDPKLWAAPEIDVGPTPLIERLHDPAVLNLLRGLVPIAARATLVGGMAGLAWRFYADPPWFLMAGAAALAYRNRNRLNLGGIFGTARFETLSALEAAGMIGRDGLLLGRYREDDFRRSRAVLRLLSRPWGESEGVCRHFLTALTGRRVDFSQGVAGPLLCLPRGHYTHLATIAPTGEGKGVNTVIPNLLNYAHSVIVVDPKGENYEKTAAYRRSLGQNVIVLDPCGVTGAVSATLDPLGILDARSPTIIEDVKAIADSLVVRTAQDSDPYWNEQSVTVLTAFILLVVCQGAPEERNLNHVRKLLTNQEEFNAALGVMIESDDLGGMLARYGGQVAAIHEKERSSILSSVNRHTNFLDSQLVAANVAATSFDIRSIATRPTSVFLVIPAQHLQSLSRLMRLWINSLLLVIKQAGASEKHEILMILDEVAQLGELRPLEEAITLLRGFGLRCWLILQSVSQLESCYSKPRARTILANCQTIQLFGIGDYETAEYLSKMMGDTTIVSPNHQEGNSGSTSSGPSGSSTRGSSSGRSYGAAARKLLQPEEILRQPDSVFVLTRGRYPILGSKIRYYEDPEFSGDAEKDPSGIGRPSVSRVSAVIAGLGLVAALYYGMGHLEWPRSTPKPESTLAAAPEETTWPVQATIRPTTGTRRPKPPSRTPEPVVTDCPRCHRRGPVPPDYAGEELTCPKCGQPFTVNLP